MKTRKSSRRTSAAVSTSIGNQSRKCSASKPEKISKRYKERCALCSVKRETEETESPNKQNVHDVDDEKRRLDFVLNSCLEISENQFLQSENVPDSQNPYFCTQDAELIETALKLHSQIQNLTKHLNILKEEIRSTFANRLKIEMIENDKGMDIDIDPKSNADPEYQEPEDSLESEIVANFETEDNDFSNLMEDEIKIEVQDVDFDFCEIDPLENENDISDEDTEETSSPKSPESTGLGPVTPELDTKTVANIDEEQVDSDPEFEVKSDSDSDYEEEKALKAKRKSTVLKKKSETSTASRISKRRAANCISKPMASRARKRKKSDADKEAVKKVRQVGRRKVYYCPVCKKRFDTIAERKVHTAAEHGPGNRFNCEHCLSEFLHKADLRTHIIRTHKSERPYSCDKCEFAYALLGDLKRHIIRKHSEKATEMISCPTCGKQFRGKYRLASHVRVIHNLGGAPRKHLVCEFCGKVYSNSDAFNDHKAKVHLATYQKMACDICGKELSDARSLKKHKASQHLKTFKFKCEICGSGCLYKSHLDAHMKSCHST